ncbi:MAG TPA: KGG domain-containing protein [Chitinophagaceae bacterium]
MPSSRNDQRGQNQGNDRGNQGGRSNRGFAAMNKEEQREIARKGGEAVSRNREHMAEIGRRGGEASGLNRSRSSQLQNQGSQSQQQSPGYRPENSTGSSGAENL